jgi:hypothetical protein
MYICNILKYSLKDEADEKLSKEWEEEGNLKLKVFDVPTAEEKIR